MLWGTNRRCAARTSSSRRRRNEIGKPRDRQDLGDTKTLVHLDGQFGPFVEKGERMTKGTGADSKASQRITNMIAELDD